MNRHIENVALLSAMCARFETALNIMTQVVGEAEGRPEWTFLQSRMTDLQTRIGRLCDEAQVTVFYRHGYYQPAVKPARRRQSEQQKLEAAGGAAALEVA